MKPRWVQITVKESKEKSRALWGKDICWLWSQGASFPEKLTLKLRHQFWVEVIQAKKKIRGKSGWQDGVYKGGNRQRALWPEPRKLQKGRQWEQAGRAKEHRALLLLWSSVLQDEQKEYKTIIIFKKEIKKKRNIAKIFKTNNLVLACTSNKG